MRILNIFFKNINSLEGEGQIHFDQGPIADSGVFAITGPNGSGKSSILDVITLGLYGETFRFGKPAEHIITKHTDNSIAQVEFAFAGEKYRSIWQVNRSFNPEMTLLHLNGQETLLAESPVQVRNFIANLIGMDFHKFSKTIVLPQGDFAAFLNALDSERLDILEKISGQELYEDYRNQILKNHSELKDKLSSLKREADLIPLLPDQTLDALVQDLEDFKEISIELNQKQTELAEQASRLQEIQALQSQHEQYKDRQLLLEKQFGQYHDDLERIKVAQQSDYFKDDVNLLQSMQTEIEQKQIHLENFQTELNLLQQQLTADDLSILQSSIQSGIGLDQQKQLIDKLKLKISEAKLELPRLTDLINTIKHQTSIKQEALAEAVKWLSSRQADEQLLIHFPEIAQLRNLRQTYNEIGDVRKSQGAWTKKASSEQSKNKTAIANTEKRLAELNALIIHNEKTLTEITQGKSIAEIKELLTDQQNRLKDFEELFSLAGVNERLTKRKGFLGLFTVKISPEPMDESEFKNEIELLRIELSKDENITRALEQAIANEALLKRMIEYRPQLVDDKPCYLCGSTQHPYSLKPPVIPDSKRALADQRSKNLLLRTKLKDLEKQLFAAQKFNNRLSAKQKFLLEKRSEWKALANRLNVFHSGLEIDNITQMERLLIAEADELERIKKIVADHAQLLRDIAKAKDEIHDKQLLLGKLRLTSEQLEADWAEKSPEFNTIEEKATALFAEEKALVDHLEKQLKSLGEKLPSKGKEDALFDKLNTRRQDYQIYQLREKGLREELAELQTKLQEYQTLEIKFQQQLNENLAALQNEEKLGLFLTVSSRKQQLFSLDQDLGNHHLALQNFTEKLTLKLSQAGFNDLNQVLELHNLIDRQTELQTLADTANAQFLTLSNQIYNLEMQLQQALLVVPEFTNPADIAAEQNKNAEKIDISEQEIRSLEIKLDKQHQYWLKHQSLEQAIIELKPLFAAAEAEMSIVSGEAGLKKHVQKILIDKLMSLTNEILEKINGRYYVRSLISEHGLALEIEDSKQNNVTRLPKTLSGGESFVVSLALALALAELANNGKAIESLFLDEGFGNLDAESLYLAMTALESLKIQGKTVGVISHVDAVKKRIKTQIELVKKANGLSELKMVA